MEIDSIGCTNFNHVWEFITTEGHSFYKFSDETGSFEASDEHETAEEAHSQMLDYASSL